MHQGLQVQCEEDKEDQKVRDEVYSKTVKHPNSGTVWGCFSSSVGCGRLHFLFFPKNTTGNGEQYEEVLESYQQRHCYFHSCMYFLLDGGALPLSHLIDNQADRDNQEAVDP